MKFLGGKSFWSLLLFLIVGAILGGILGEILNQANFSDFMPFFTKTYELINLQNFYINLYVIQFGFSIVFAPNLISILGILLAVYIFRRL